MRYTPTQQNPRERIKNFFEVALGFSPEEARSEASRCLQCAHAPCSKKCPVEIDIPAFIRLIREGKQKEALEKIKERNNLPAVCGRVCPQENQCESACVLHNKKIPINIGALERYAAEYESAGRRVTGMGVGPADTTARRHADTQTRGHADPRPKIAVVGSGPAGLTCAADCAKMGYAATIFESLHVPGGVLVYGIPEFRLPKEIVAGEVDYIRSLGVDIRTDTLIGATYTIGDFFTQGFRAVFIAVGAGLPRFLGIPGENLNGVYSANEFLTRINLMKAYRFPRYATPVRAGAHIAVVGGGNVALDCARCARRLGKEVMLVYRRTREEMPARADEVENAREEGIVFQYLTQPARMIGDGKGNIAAMECLLMELAEPDSTGRRRPVPIRNSEFILDVDTVIVGIGQNPNPLLPRLTKDLRVNPDGTVQVDDNFMTSLPGVFAGGDIITGADTVIAAMGAGKKAAVKIDAYIRKTPH